MRWKLAVTTLCTTLVWSAPAFAQSPEPGEDAELNAVEALTVEEAEDGTYIRIHGSDVASFSVFKLDDPPRLFVDLSNSRVTGQSLDEDVYNGVISRVGMVEFGDGFQDVARLVVGFEEAAHYDVRTEGNDVIVFVDGADRDRGAVAVDDQALHQREAELADARQRLEQTEQRYRSEAQQHEQAYSSAKDELDSTRSELEAARQELAAMEEQLQEATGLERRRLQRSIAVQNEALEKARAQVEQRQAEVDELRQTMARLENERDAERQRYEEAQAQAEQARAQAEEARVQAEEARAQADELQGRLGEMDGEVAAAESRIEEQRKQLEEARSTMARLETQLAAAREDGEDEAVERFEAERARWQQVQNERQQKLERAQADARQAEQRMVELQEAIAERDEEIAALRATAREAEAQAEREASRRAELQAERDAAQREGQAARAVAVDPADENTIQSVRLQTGENGRTQIVVDLQRPGQFRTTRGGDGRAVMILNNVSLPTELERTLSADADGGAVRFVSSFAEDDGTVRMEADLRGEASEVIRQDGNQVVWEFAPAMADGDSGRLAGDNQPRRTTEGASVTSAPPNYPRVVTDPTMVNTVPGMGRQRVTIDMRNADIQNVLRFISSESGINIIAGDDVGGDITMRLQGVPMEEAFLTILQSMQLGFEIRGNVLRVAPQSVLNEEEQARAQARAEARAVEPLEVFLLPVNYASASELTNQVDGLLSPRGSVSVDNRTNTLIIKDVRGNLSSIRTLIETLDAQVPQVLIEARIVETNENFDRAFGIQWGGDFSFSQGSGNPTGLIFPNVLGMSGGATDSEAPVEGTSENPNYAVNLPAAAGTGSGGAIGLTMGSVGGAVNLNMRLSALEDAGYAKIISAPRILTLDNREATISQGTSIPISVVSAAGVQTVFVDATLELTVTPHVTPDGNVRMSIQATKAEPDFQNTGARGDPTIIQNQAETELLVDDGDTTVIGGIYTENTGHSVSAVPFLHRIPILGALFRAQSKTENRSELLIFITPRIVNRAEALGVMSTGTLESNVPMND